MFLSYPVLFLFGIAHRLFFLVLRAVTLPETQLRDPHQVQLRLLGACHLDVLPPVELEQTTPDLNRDLRLSSAERESILDQDKSPELTPYILDIKLPLVEVYDRVLPRDRDVVQPDICLVSAPNLEVLLLLHVHDEDPRDKIPLAAECLHDEVGAIELWDLDGVELPALHKEMRWRGKKCMGKGIPYVGSSLCRARTPAFSMTGESSSRCSAS